MWIFECSEWTKRFLFRLWGSILTKCNIPPLVNIDLALAMTEPREIFNHTGICSREQNPCTSTVPTRWGAMLLFYDSKCGEYPEINPRVSFSLDTKCWSITSWVSNGIIHWPGCLARSLGTKWDYLSGTQSWIGSQIRYHIRTVSLERSSEPLVFQLLQRILVYWKWLGTSSDSVGVPMTTSREI